MHFDSPDRVNKRAEEYSQVELIGGGTEFERERESEKRQDCTACARVLPSWSVRCAAIMAHRGAVSLTAILERECVARCSKRVYKCVSQTVLIEINLKRNLNTNPSN